MKRLIVGISGASGAIYGGVRLLQVLRDVADIETIWSSVRRRVRRWRWRPTSLRDVAGAGGCGTRCPRYRCQHLLRLI